jgi:hypothetical protein
VSIRIRAGRAERGQELLPTNHGRERDIKGGARD